MCLLGATVKAIFEAEEWLAYWVRERNTAIVDERDLANSPRLRIVLI